MIMSGAVHNNTGNDRAGSAEAVSGNRRWPGQRKVNRKIDIIFKYLQRSQPLTSQNVTGCYTGADAIVSALQQELKMPTPVQSAKGDETHLRVIVYPEGDLYVAQCLERDIATQAPDISALLERLDLTIDAECAMSRENGEEPFARIAPAPNYFQGLWEKRSVNLQHRHIPVHQHLTMEVALAAAA